MFKNFSNRNLFKVAKPGVCSIYCFWAIKIFLSWGTENKNDLPTLSPWLTRVKKVIYMFTDFHISFLISMFPPLKLFLFSSTISFYEITKQTINQTDQYEEKIYSKHAHLHADIHWTLWNYTTKLLAFFFQSIFRSKYSQIWLIGSFLNISQKFLRNIHGINFFLIQLQT